MAAGENQATPKNSQFIIHNSLLNNIIPKPFSFQSAVYCPVT